MSLISESTSGKTYSEPLAGEGPLVITFFVKRVKGTFGEITVLFFFFLSTSFSNQCDWERKTACHNFIYLLSAYVVDGALRFW